jgi:hypothetical protein
MVEKAGGPRNPGVLIAALSTGAIALLTLSPSPGDIASAVETPLTCLVCGDRGGVDVLLNLLLFIPLGVGLRMAGSPIRVAAIAAILLSLTVELLQYFVVVGRDASLSDLMFNTAGAALGASVEPRLRSAVRPSAPLARRLFATGVALWLAILALSAWLQQPGAAAGALTSVWGPRTPGSDSVHGEVTSVRLDAVAMPARGPVPDTAKVGARFRGGEWVVEVAAVSGPPTELQSWLYAVEADGAGQLLLSHHRSNIVLAVPARALRYRLHPPTLSLPDGFPRDPGVPVQIAGGRSGATIWLRSTHAGGTYAVRLALSPAHGWALIAPFSIARGPGTRVVTAVVLALCILPLGYWGASTGRPVAAAALALAVAAGLGGLPAAAGYPPVHWSEWLAAALAAVAGWVLREPVAYLQLRCASPSSSVSS